MSVIISARRLALDITSHSRHSLPTRTFSTTTRRRADPWPLPHTPQHLSNTQTPSDIPPPTPIPRPGELKETMRARLVYQSRKRGTLESDLLLSTFARDHLQSMDEVELREYDKVRFSSLIAGSLDLCFIALWLSYSTSQTGTYIIGRLKAGHHLSGGGSRPYWRSSRYMQKMKERSCVKCLRFRHSNEFMTAIPSFLSLRTEPDGV
jgi:hypothetical protein